MHSLGLREIASHFAHKQRQARSLRISTLEFCDRGVECAESTRGVKRFVSDILAVRFERPGLDSHNPAKAQKTNLIARSLKMKQDQDE
jgi:hypothetical protein